MGVELVAALPGCTSREPWLPENVCRKDARLVTMNILVATDFGDASMEAMSWAFRFAEPLGASVHLLYVFVDDSPVGHAEALGALHAIAAQHEGSAAFGSYTVLAGEPAQKVVEFALTSGAELLVVGLNGGRGAKAELLGGRAERILRDARCPVVVVRPSELNLLAIAEERRRDDA
jgi:nucleotide-binding universal stress UspA family protein